MRILRDEPLAKYTTFKIGGPADYFLRVRSGEELIEAVRKAKAMRVPYFVLGGGSNLLVGDKGYRGMVIKNEMSNIRIVGYKGEIKYQISNIKYVYVEAESGVLVNRLVRYTLDQGLAGLENFLGQPGTIGGAIYINAHNMKADDFVGEHIVRAKLLTANGEVKIVDQQYFEFAYDKSKIQETREIVLSLVLRLKKVEGKGKQREKVNQVMEYRQKTQPQGVGSSGCAFRNIAKAEALRIGTPKFTTSAGFLLDTCGLKGKQIGGVKFSEKHANFIVNVGEAKASDVLKLIELAKMRVRERFGIDLKEEIVKVGEF